MGVDSQTTSVEVWEGQDFAILARIMSPSGVVMTRSHVTDYTVNIFDATSGVESSPIYTKTSASEAEIMLASLTNDGWWNADSTGYTMIWRVQQDLLDASVKFEGGHNYIVEILLTADSDASTASGVIPVITYVTVRSRPGG